MQNISGEEHSVVICRRGNSWGEAGTEEAETKGSESPGGWRGEGGTGEKGGVKSKSNRGKRSRKQNPRDRHQARYGYYYCSERQEGRGDGDVGRHVDGRRSAHAGRRSGGLLSYR
ncbi:hypothetical protein BO85DRAFT_208360 [Aspergillus piperis CBS 112811]|uniref:Uncharacterized protein n=1 Tax=Aspergillus piperis CBS 112811 TaxID=1448313 RepID=A0A8G1QT73_9EURO|nr:hypothetical protein BO85DRAFT_208360 [Aspergillus piperis CBS 112811]RAH52139.1 hypothetical protein BO85DRAFT_208360 [Aspergillus piperis CBS 112811]